MPTGFGASIANPGAEWSTEARLRPPSAHSGRAWPRLDRTPGDVDRSTILRAISTGIGGDLADVHPVRNSKKQSTRLSTLRGCWFPTLETVDSRASAGPCRGERARSSTCGRRGLRLRGGGPVEAMDEHCLGASLQPLHAQACTNSNGRETSQSSCGEPGAIAAALPPRVGAHLIKATPAAPSPSTPSPPKELNRANISPSPPRASRASPLVRWWRRALSRCR